MPFFTGVAKSIGGTVGFGKKRRALRNLTFRLTLDGSPAGSGGGRTVADITVPETLIPDLYIRTADGRLGYHNGGIGYGEGSPGGGSSALYYGSYPNWLIVVGGAGGGGGCSGPNYGGGGIGNMGSPVYCTDPGPDNWTGAPGQPGPAGAGADGSRSDPGGGGGGGAGASGGSGGVPYKGNNPGGTRDGGTAGGGGAGNMDATNGPAPKAPDVTIVLVTGTGGGAGPTAGATILYNGITYPYGVGLDVPLGNLPSPINW